MARPKCRHCGQDIMFIRLDTGSLMPVNPTPEADGNVCAAPTGAYWRGWVVSATKPAKSPSEGFRLYMPHVVICQPDKPRLKTRPTPPESLF